MNSSTRFSLPRSAALAVLCLAGCGPAAAQEATVDVPAAVSFNVFDVSASALGSPDPTRLQFTSITLQPDHVLRVSVRAEAATFTPPAPGGSEIPASRITWTTSGAQGGSGTPGTLSDTGYGQVFQTSVQALTAQVDIRWTLEPIAGGVRAGWHDLTLRWKLESVVP